MANVFFKHCKKCDTKRDLIHFSRDKSTKDGYKFYCRVCAKKSRALYYINNKEKITSTNKKWVKNNKPAAAVIARRYRNKNKDNYRNRQLVRNFGITLEEYNLLYSQQEGRCKLCDQEQESKALAVDHCHSTGKIRGLLCNTCNTGLGMFKDSTSLLRVAIAYLRDNS